MTVLAHLLAPLSSVLVTVGHDRVSLARTAGFATAPACLWLAGDARIGTFPAGIASSACFGALSGAIRLPAGVCLQVAYLLLALAGWWQWRHGGAQPGRPVIGRASVRMLAGCLLFVVVASPALTALLGRVHDPVPGWDALALACCLAAQFLLNCKRIETWPLWIAASLAGTARCVITGLDLTALDCLLLLALSWLGLRCWWTALRGGGHAPGPVPL